MYIPLNICLEKQIIKMGTDYHMHKNFSRKERFSQTEN